MTQQEKIRLLEIEFGVASLCRLNMIVLNALQKEKNQHENLNKIFNQCCQEIGFNSNVPLLHQGAFLSYAYTCLVWLWEKGVKLNKGNIDTEILERIDFDFNEIIKICGPRLLDTRETKLRLLRNAISHGKVDIHGDVFIFEDQNLYRGGEREPTRVKLSWTSLGNLCDSILDVFNDILLAQKHS